MKKQISRHGRNAFTICLLTGLSISAGTQIPVEGANHGPMRSFGVGPDGAVVSPNWSGYAVTGAEGSITAVTGSWIVPEASCAGSDPKNSGASHWVGIDGYTTRTVEQTGTDSDCSKGEPNYYAWYEFYPDPGITIESISVAAGDVMLASVSYSQGEFTATIRDQRTQQSFSITKAVPSARRNSAEWIAEDNAARFTNFGTVYFGEDETGLQGTCAATATEVSGPIGAFPSALVHAITMVDSQGVTMSVPSPLSPDGTTFSAQWQAAR